MRERRNLALTGFVIFVLALAIGAGVATLHEGDAAPTKPWRYHHGTAHAWFRQTQDWQGLYHREKKIAAKYRRLNDRLLKLCPTG